jgi:hypothetical protein
MADVSKIEGPSGAPESFGKKDKGTVDAEKFKQEMRRRVTEVSQVDPDEQKKRKRREEAEEPLEEVPEGPTTPASQVTPFSLEKEQKKISPLEMQGGPGISPTESAQKATLPSPSAVFFQAPSIDEMTDDSGILEEDSFMESGPSTLEKAATPTFVGTEAPPVQPPPQPPQVSEGMTPQQPVVAGPPESRQPETGQQAPERKPAQPPTGPPPRKKPSVPGQEPKLAGLKAKQEKSGMTAAEMEGAQPSKAQDTRGFFKQFGKEGEGEKKGKQAETPEELKEEAEIPETGAPGHPPPFVQALEGKEEKKVEETPIEMGGIAMAGPTGEALGAATSPTPEFLPSYAHLHPQVMEIFDRMVGVMTVMSMSGMTETVITLNAPQFASSVFFGSQIIIQEFSTAPQAFNIQLNGTPQAVTLFQDNVNDLLAAFQAGNYNFRINRLETGYLTERPLFKRKEKAGGKEKDTESQSEK